MEKYLNMGTFLLILLFITMILLNYFMTTKRFSKFSSGSNMQSYNITIIISVIVIAIVFYGHISKLNKIEESSKTKKSIVATSGLHPNNHAIDLAYNMYRYCFIF